MTNVSRYPWPWIVATLAIAIVLYALALLYASARITDVRRQSLAQQQTRLNQEALRLEDEAGIAVQLAHIATVTLRGDRRREDLERDVRRLLAASDRSVIYGVGVFYAPFAFDRDAMRFGVYRYASRGRDVEQWVIPGNAYDYVPRPWYVAALHARGKPAFTGPYESAHGLSFIGASEAFDIGGRPGGVVLVEATQPALDAMLTSTLSAGELVWVTDKSGVILGKRPVSTYGDNTASTHLSIAPWTLYLASSFPLVDAARRDAWAIGLPVTIFYWTAVGLTIYALIRYRRLQLRTIALQETASRDGLTGLRNRAYMLGRLDRALGSFASDPQRNFGILFVDLDRFAVVNDSLGHAVGDKLLCAIAQRMLAILPDGAELGRIGGDEFVAHLPLTGVAAAELIADLVIRSLNQPFEVDEREVYISASIGILMSAPRYATAGEMLRDADTAMYAAKNSGRSRFAIFDEKMRENVLARHSLENALRRAVSNGRLFARYQPIVNLRTGRVASMEALARWTTEDGQSIPPSVFIPLAEQTGAIESVDTIVLEQACAAAKGFQRCAPGITMSVNFSATRLHRGDLAAKTSAAAEDAGLDPRLLKVELTETAIMDRPDDGLGVLERLRDLGMQVIIDDFGTGHSSLSYAQRLPVAGLKIDRSFVEPMARDRQSLAIVRAVVALAKTLGLYVVAEGVEDEDQVEKLRTMGVEYGQGYYFAPALAIDEMESFIALRESLYTIPPGSVATAS
ncbi:MAG: EAL domain-containing protein [Candidatus Eremiobacteraeota bacterium]|nr:EAL domain-containing protein [Candidatus Eremiobacteraeota bacterium]MBV8722159.1 EAL domain-containing protein [Candidatus Eremiobacteraeota bacterium]